MLKLCSSCERDVHVYEYETGYVEVEDSNTDRDQRYYFCQMECLYVWAAGKLMASLGETLRNIKKGERD